MKTGKENGRSSAGPELLEEGLDARLVEFGGELRALAEAIRPRSEFVTALRQDVRTGLAAPARPAARRKPVRLRRFTRAHAAGILLLAAILLAVLVLAVIRDRQAVQSRAEVVKAQSSRPANRLPQGAQRMLGKGQALSLASGPTGALALGSTLAVCLVSPELVQLWCARQDSAVTQVALTSDGSLIAAGRADGLVVLFDQAGNQLGQAVSFGQDAVVGLGWLSEKPPRLAAVTRSAATGVWDVERAVFAWEPWRVGGSAQGLAIEPGKALLAVAGDAGIQVLDGGSGMLVHRENAGLGQPVSVGFDPEGKFLAAGLDFPDGEAALAAWSLKDWAPLGSWPIDSAAESLWVGAGNRFAAVSQSGQVWLGEAGRPGLRSLVGVRPGSPLAPSASKQSFYAVGQDGSIVRLNVELASMRLVWKEYTGAVSAVRWQGEELLQAIYSDAFLSDWKPKSGELVKMQAINTLDGSPQNRNNLLYIGHGRGRFLARSEDGSQVLMALDGEAVLVDEQRGLVVARLGGHTGEVVQGVFSADGSQVVTADQAARLRIWNSAEGRLVRTHELQTIGSTVTGLGWLPGLPGEAAYLAVTWLVSARYALDLIDPDSGQVERMTGIKESLGRVAWSKDGRWVASVVGRGVAVWDVRSKKQAWTLSLDPTDWRSVSLAFSPDGRYLAAGGRHITLWDMETGRKTRTLAGHQDYATALDFSPGGESLASGSSDGTIIIWKIK